MSDLYPRTIAINRPNSAAAPSGGKVDYVGQNRTQETSLFSGIPASIQSRSVGSRRSGTDKLAADAPGPIVWVIFVPKGQIDKGAVKDSDIVIDDEGVRYLVAAAYWNVLGWNLQTIRLEM